MRVERFSLFFGPMIWKVRRGETEYGIGPIPLGGYVKITGMNPNEEISPEVARRAYYNQKVWKRIVVILAGPAVNLLIAFVIIWGLFLSNGADGREQADRSRPEVDPGGDGAARRGDQLVSVDGVSSSPDALRNQLAHAPLRRASQVNGCLAAKPAAIVVKRNGQVLTFELPPRYSAADHRPLVGFGFGSTRSRSARSTRRR